MDRPFDAAQDRNLGALLDYLAARASMPFAWGRYGNDCVSFAAYAVKAQTGQHRLDALGRRLRWSSKAEALRDIAREGGIEAALDRRFRRIAPAAAMRGDIAGVADPVLGLRLMIVEGDTLAGPGARGLKRSPRRAMVAAWSLDGARDERNGLEPGP